MSHKNINILLIEDEISLALELLSIIKSYGYSGVHYVTNANAAYRTIKEHTLELLIIDIDLKDEDAIELYKNLHQDIKVIYFTAHKDDATLSKAIDTEPLGYLLKPLNATELLALLKLAQLKQDKNTTHKIIELGYGYRFDIESEMLFYYEEFVHLGKKQLTLLKMLIEAQGRVVTFSEIEERLYRDNPPSESSIRTLVYRLRSQLKFEMIESEQKYGVRLYLCSTQY